MKYLFTIGFIAFLSLNVNGQIKQDLLETMTNNPWDQAQDAIEKTKCVLENTMEFHALRIEAFYEEWDCLLIRNDYYGSQAQIEFTGTSISYYQELCESYCDYIINLNFERCYLDYDRCMDRC